MPIQGYYIIGSHLRGYAFLSNGYDILKCTYPIILYLIN